MEKLIKYLFSKQHPFDIFFVGAGVIIALILFNNKPNSIWYIFASVCIFFGIAFFLRKTYEYAYVKVKFKNIYNTFSEDEKFYIKWVVLDNTLVFSSIYEKNPPSLLSLTEKGLCKQKDDKTFIFDKVKIDAIRHSVLKEIENNRKVREQKKIERKKKREEKLKKENINKEGK
ncbi:MAG: hypothetical protein FWF00_06180 [Endomicrobia bacterium]|nr:hypothetical protein [Endomicrobiia bacterium]MCL2507254.1 hypothetical protein [Endomicrobiia bacterium]